MPGEESTEARARARGRAKKERDKRQETRDKRARDRRQETREQESKRERGESLRRRRRAHLPKPPENVDEADLLRVVHHFDALRMARASRAGLLVRRVGRKASAVADRRAVDAVAWQPPDALLGSPEAAIGKDGDLVALGHIEHLVSKHIVPVWHHHLLFTAGQSILWVDEPFVRRRPAAQQVEDRDGLDRSDARLHGWRGADGRHSDRERELRRRGQKGEHILLAATILCDFRFPSRRASGLISRGEGGGVGGKVHQSQ